MAASTLPAPGEKFGPCETDRCGHIDCGCTRVMAAKVCRHCQKPIGYRVRFFNDPLDDAERLVHEKCELAKVEGSAQ